MEFFDLRYNTKFADGGNFEIGYKADSWGRETMVRSRKNCLIHGIKLGIQIGQRSESANYDEFEDGGCAC